MAITLTQCVTGSVINDYGLDNIPFTITNPAQAGSAASTNILVAQITWNVAFFTYQSSGKSPSVNVTDSAGNLWRQVGASGPNPGSRSAIWVCVNARQVSWVSVALTGWGYSTTYAISEFGGIPATLQSVVLDFEQDIATTAAVTTLTAPTSVAQTTADFGLALVGVGGSASTFSTPAGWTKTTGGLAGGSGTFVTTLQPYWAATLATGSLAFAPTWTTAGPASVVVLGLSTAAAAPIQPRATFPRVVVEAGFSATPGDWTEAVEYTYDQGGLYWTDISTRCIGDDQSSRISVTRGRQYELAQEETGELTMTLDNHDGAFTLSNPGSPYYSNALNQNMSFQNTLLPWTALNSATITLSNTHAFASGSGAIAVNSLQFNGNGTVAKPGVKSENIPINPNYTYSASTWFYSGTLWASGVNTDIAWISSAGATISTSTVATVPLAASTWTQAAIQTITPPTNATFAQVQPHVLGTPTSGQAFFIAESMLVPGSPGTFLTGNLTPGTPLRVTAWWTQPGGLPIQYPIGYGYAERWPQDWPDLPQWGFTEVIATDAYGALGSVSLPSAVGGDIRKDYPYAYFPTNEQYSFTSQSLDPVKAPIDANGLIAVNYAFGNNRFGAYRDGTGAGVAVGQALNLLGSQDTVLGVTTYQAQDTNDNGPAMFYFDPNIPTNGASGTGSFSLEFWFMWGYGGEFSTSLLNVFGRPSTFYDASTAPTHGGVITVAINTGSNSGIYVNNTLVAANPDGNFTPFNQALFTPQHFVLSVGPNGNFCYLNGQLCNQGGVTINPPIGNIPQIKAVVLGPGRISYENSFNIVYNSFNYVAGHLAIYPQELTPTMINNHFASGFNGWVGVTAPYRFSQVLTWGLLGLKRGGVMWAGSHGTSQNTLISEAYDLEGSNASDVLNQLVATEGGRCFTQGNGSIVYIPRWSLYNTGSATCFGDNGTTEIPFLQESSFMVDNTFINNQINVTQNRGPNQDIFYQQTNFPSQLEFFNRSGLQIQSYAMSPFDVYGVVDWNMAKYNFPVMRVDHISVNPSSAQGALPQTFAQILSLELEQGAIVNRRPIGAGTAGTFTVNGSIQRIQHSIGPNEWGTQLQICPRFPESNVLVANQAGWTFSSSGTPTLNNYFIVTTAQAASIQPGNDFTDTVNSGQQFTVTSLSVSFAGFVNVSFVPNANSIMTSDTVTQVPFNTLGSNYLAWLACRACQFSTLILMHFLQ